MPEHEIEPEGLPPGVDRLDVALMSWAGKERILSAARRTLEHVRALAPADLDEWGPERIELAHAVGDLEDANALPAQDHDADLAWLRAGARYMEALIDLKREGVIA